MTPYRRAVLSAVDEGRGRFGWYQIELRLMQQTFDEREYLPGVLQEFIDRAWLTFREDGDRKYYSITDAGRRRLGVME